MMKPTMIAGALATGLSTGLAAIPAAADPVVNLPVQQVDSRFTLQFGFPGVVFAGPRYDRRYYYDDRYTRRELRSERIERRLEGRFVGYYPREIRRNLRDMGFRRIDIAPAGRGFRVAALRNGNEFGFRIGGRSGVIRRAERF
ncbi:MAG: hypothetical protein AAGE83_08055 [Pseudomonadota bacterium]